MQRSSEDPVRAFNVLHLAVVVYFCCAAFELHSHGPRPLTWLGYILEGLGFVLLARTGRTALRDLWQLPFGRASVLLIVAGLVLLFLPCSQSGSVANK